jgi:glycosyltransferase involved in cell wall biosynthesis
VTLKDAERARVLHVIVGLGAGGAEATLANFISASDRRRFETMVISLTDRGVYGDSIERSGARVVALGTRAGVPDPRAFFRVRKVVREYRPHLIQSWMYHADVLAALVTRTTRAPLLWNVRCSYIDLNAVSWVTRITIRLAAAMSGWPQGAVVNSICGRDYHDRRLGFHVRRWHFIPNGIDIRRFRPDSDARGRVRGELGIDGVTPLVGFLARHDGLKDHATFFAAAAEIARETPAHFLLAGTGMTFDNRAVSQLASRPELAGRVHLAGYRADGHRLMAALDLHMSSSIAEGFPNVVAEAMACGVACVSTDVGDAKAIIGDAGTVVPPGDPAALARAALAFLTAPAEERRRTSEASRERILTQFSLEAAVARYENLYLDTISSCA